MSRGYDAIIVGARCAGAPTAMLLARRGYRVLLIDKVSFPSDTLSTHYIQPQGVQKLKHWGLLEQIKQSDCPPIRKVSLFSGPAFLRSLFMDLGPDGETYCPRRTILDTLLIQAAAKAGAEVRERFLVSNVLHDNGAACGVSGHTALSRTISERATVTIGADGFNSLVARHVGATSVCSIPMETFYAYSYWNNVGINEAEIYFGHCRAVTAFPTNAHRTCVTVVWPQHEAKKLQNNIEANYKKTLELFPKLYDRLRAGEREARIYRTKGQRCNFVRIACGTGWALVGDASCHKDPITAFGISDAFRDAELLAKAIDRALSGSEPLDAALCRYQRQRNSAVAPLFNFTLEAAEAMQKFAGAQAFEERTRAASLKQ